MEKNAWKVAKQVIAMVDDEPGPAKDYCLEVLHDDNCSDLIDSSFLTSHIL